MVSRYCFGFHQIDDEQDLIDQLLEKFNSSQDGPYSPELTGSVLADLYEHMIKHFNSEEMLMKATNFPGIDKHRREHKKLIDRINDLLDQPTTEPEQSLGNDIIDIIIIGLIAHTESFDRPFHEWYSSIKWSASDMDRFRGQIDSGRQDNHKKAEQNQ